MTLDELSMLQNAVMDATEAYCDERLKPENLPFARNEIGVIDAVEEVRGKRYHTVRVGTATRYKKYKNVLSVGNIKFDIGNVVLLIIPSGGGESQSFILGKLDNSPAAIIGGTIKIGEIPGSDPIDYYFKVSDSGEVVIQKGGFLYGWDDTLQEYNYKITKDGVYSGLYADANGNPAHHFSLTNKGVFKVDSGKIELGGVVQDDNGITTTGVKIDPVKGLTMDMGSIKLGKITSTRYHTELNDDGTFTLRNDDGKSVFEFDGQTATITGYLEENSFNTSTVSDRTKIDGAHLATGYIASQNLRGQSSLAAYNGTYTSSGTIIDLNSGFLSSKNFIIDSSGNATFRGSLSACRGTLSDGVGTLEISGGDIHMRNNNWGGAGVFCHGPGDLYSCWGARNSAARADGRYLEVPTYDIIDAGDNASDRRLKQNIKDIDKDFAKTLIMGVKPKSFEYLRDKETLRFGVIAQEVREVLTDLDVDLDNVRLCYTNTETEMYAVDYRQFIAPLIKVVQEQQKEINELKEKIGGK